ncbi:MAG TPA: gamma-glutamylcyclotransferase family protein [Terracidiphilus sp.]|nr:gamma-glutamylcyclotransferase family protein [Terracidiphilus sp.]
MDGSTIFVYGTLKRGCRNHHFLKSAEFLGEALTEPGYRMIDCGSYPGMVRADNGERVTGEVYRVDASLLAALDRFEDAPDEYLRTTIRLSDGRAAQAYLYRGPTAHLPACAATWKEK